MKRALTLLLATALLTLTGTAPAAQPKATPLPDITIYHLEGRRSERIVWLMEELGMPYKLEFKRGDLAGSMAAIKAYHLIWMWFGGAEFSAADIMMKFPLDVATNLNIVDANEFPNVAAWKTKIEARPAYQRMRAK